MNLFFSPTRACIDSKGVVKVHPEKELIGSDIPEYEWIVASSSYLNEFYKPLSTIRLILVSISLVTLIVVLLLTFKISSLITIPLSRLVMRFNRHPGEILKSDWRAGTATRSDSSLNFSTISWTNWRITTGRWKTR